MDILPAAFWQGVEQFNQHEFYACHDTMEALWMEAIEPDKTFYQGILQVAVALYHLENRNWRGAVILLGEGSHRLHPYTPTYADLDLDLFLSQVTHLLRMLQQTGPDQVEAIAQRLQDQTELAVPSDLLDLTESADLPALLASPIAVPWLGKVAV